MLRPLLFSALLLVPTLAQAQVSASGLVSPAAARQAGLERMWFTQLSLDRARGRVSGVFMHVSPIQSHTVFEVKHSGKRYVFSERDRNAFGEEIGIDVAQEKADKKAVEIQQQLIDAGNPDAQKPAIEKYVVPKITIYATSERGLVHALDGETGRTLWSTVIGNPLYPTSTPAANDKYVGACNGSTLYVLLAADGSVAWTRPADGVPGAGPALTEEYIFLPLVNGQVESFLLDEPKRPAGVYKSYGRTMVQPVVSSNSVAWPTDSGNLYVSLAHAPGLRFRLQATDGINSAPAFLDPDKMFATSLDGYIYCLNERKGNMLWRFTTGEPIAHSPVALGQTVYAISKRGNMYAIDVNSAAERWVIGGMRSYLAGNERRLYCIDVRGDLAILDTATGSRLGTITGIPSEVPVLNAQTDRILLVSTTGLVQCLREINLPFPVVHYQIEPQKKVAKPVPKTTAQKSEEKPAQPADADPFAPGATKPAAAAPTDPFAAPPPAKPAAPPGANPFGSP
jgi:outer membrane protein assembly factor BamB